MSIKPKAEYTVPVVITEGVTVRASGWITQPEAQILHGILSQPEPEVLRTAHRLGVALLTTPNAKDGSFVVEVRDTASGLTVTRSGVLGYQAARVFVTAAGLRNRFPEGLNHLRRDLLRIAAGTACPLTPLRPFKPFRLTIS